MEDKVLIKKAKKDDKEVPRALATRTFRFKVKGEELELVIKKIRLQKILTK